MANEPVRGSNIIAAVKPTLDANGEIVPVRLTADDSYTPPRLIVELPDRALRDLGVVTLASGSLTIGSVKITDGTDSATVRPLSGIGALDVSVVDGSGNQITSFGGGTQYADGAARGTATGTIAMGDDGTNIQSIKVDTSGELQVDVLTLPNVAQSTASNLNAQVVGAVAHDTAVSGNPILNAAEARDTKGTVVATGDVVRLSADRYGRLHRVSPVLSHTSSNGTAITTATDTSVVSAPAASNHLRIYRIHATNAGATSTYVYWRDGVAGTKLFPMFLAQNAVVSLKLDGCWDLTTATALYINTSAAGSVEWHVVHETVAD